MSDGTLNGRKIYGYHRNATVEIVGLHEKSDSGWDDLPKWAQDLWDRVAESLGKDLDQEFKDSFKYTDVGSAEMRASASGFNRGLETAGKMLRSSQK